MRFRGNSQIHNFSGFDPVMKDFGCVYDNIGRNFVNLFLLLFYFICKNVNS